MPTLLPNKAVGVLGRGQKDREDAVKQLPANYTEVAEFMTMVRSY
jgi:hypothetical protein